MFETSRLEHISAPRIKIPLSMLVEGCPVSMLRGDAPAERAPDAFESYIRNLIQVLEQSPTGRALTRAAADHGVSVGLDALLEPNSSFFYARQNHFDLGYQPDLLQKTEKGMSRYLISFIAGLRRSGHHHAGFGSDVSLLPADFVEHFRFMEADIDAVTHLIAWELRGNGQSFLWRALLSGGSCDITHVFEQSISDNPHNQFNGAALKAAFNQWFADRARGNDCDHLALETIDAALMQQGGMAIAGARHLSRDDLQHLGRLPSGGNYLAGCLFTCSWYRGMDDAFNRHHLLHIEQDIAQATGK